MPQFEELLAKAQQKQTKKSFSRGNRPDRIASGQIEFSPSVPNQLDSKSTAERQQLDSSQAGNGDAERNLERQQLDSKSTAERQPENPLDSNWTPNWTAGRQQLDSKSTAERQQLDSKNWSVDALSGKEAELVHLLFFRCKNAGTRQTEKLSSHNLCDALKVSTKRLRNLIERLAGKNILIVSSSKRGNGSWRQFTLPNAVYQEMALNHLDSKSTAERQPLDSNWTPDWAPNKTAERSSSSSKDLDLNKLTTTGDSEASANLPAEWNAIDGSLLTEIRFGRNQLVQLFRAGKLTPEQVQDSIYAFAFDLEHNGKAKKLTSAPLNYFMGTLRNGPYAAPGNYESPEDMQRRLYLEAKEQQRKKRQEMDERLEAVEFEEWAEKLTSEEKARLVPPKDFAKPGGTAHSYQLRAYFRENIWPQFREKMLQEVQLKK